MTLEVTRKSFDVAVDDGFDGGFKVVNGRGWFGGLRDVLNEGGGVKEIVAASDVVERFAELLVGGERRVEGQPRQHGGRHHLVRV